MIGDASPGGLRTSSTIQEQSLARRTPESVIVEVLVPEIGPASIDSLLADLEAVAPATPFAADRLAFMATLARELRILGGRTNPAIQALAYWMRPAEVERLAQAFGRLGDPHTLLMPRGTAFHVPPTNVDTIFVYSLALSLLTGNRNIVRLSTRARTAAEPILAAIRSAASAHPEVGDGLRIISYGHDDSANAALTRACDVRVLWGGDATIQTFRNYPLPPHATELAFADRFSMAALRTENYSGLSDEGRSDLADKFVNDTYWFDQLGCSSARLLIWVGDQNPDLAGDFHAHVRSRAAAKGFTVDTAAAIAKIGQSFRSMIDGTITGFHWYDNVQVVLDTATFPPARGEFCGAGLFYQWMIPDLAALAPHIRREDQTMTVFGFSDDELREFAISLRGKGIDRFVPFGQALAFNRIWDGHDLLQSFTRRVCLA